MPRKNLQGARRAVLCLICLAGTVLSGGALALRLGSATLPVAPSSAQGLIRAPNRLPIASPVTPPAPALPSQFLVGELSNEAAPVPYGPSTYVPILLYHYIRINPNPKDRLGFNLSTPPAMFRAQMQYLADHGFHVLPLHEVVLAIAHHLALPSRSVVLTFDDGYSDFFTAAVPAMTAHGFTATDFVISGRMGVFSFMTAAQVQAANGMGFTIGAHTVDHYALAALAPARATWEIRQSKLTLEKLLGHPVVDFAYPYGSYNNYDAAEVTRVGFECAVSTLTGTIHSSGQLMFLSRVRIGGAMGLNTYANLVGGPAPTSAELGAAGAAASPSPRPR